MHIRLPNDVVFYSASDAEPHFLLCWIPAKKLGQLLTSQVDVKDLLRRYPNGIEVEATESSFDAFGLDFGVEPRFLRAAYEQLHATRRLPPHGMVKKDHLVQLATQLGPDASWKASGLRREAIRTRIGPSPTILRDIITYQPSMTPGEEASIVFKRFAHARGVPGDD